MAFEKHYTITEVAETIGVHPDTIRKAIKDRKLTAAKFARDWRISESSINTYIKSKTVEAIKR